MSYYLGAVEGWVVTRDGETLKTGFKDANEAFKWLSDHTSQSWDWEIRYGGYDIVLVRGGKVEYSAKREQEQERHAGKRSPEAMAEEFEHAVRRAFIDVYGDPLDLEVAEQAIRSSYLEPGRKQGWTEPNPNVVIVGSEYAKGPRDMFASNEDMRRWEAVVDLLQQRGWHGAWFDSINAGVHVIYWKPQAAGARQEGSLGAVELIELGSGRPGYDTYNELALDREGDLQDSMGAKRPRRVKPTQMPFKKAQAAARRMEKLLRTVGGVEDVILVGSMRRKAQVVGDIEFVVLVSDLEPFLTYLGDDLGFTGGDRKRVGETRSGEDRIPVEIYIAHDPLELGSMVFMYTGDWQFNIAMRSKAKKRGFKLNQYGIWEGERAVLRSEDERDFFKFLGVRYHAPEERSLASRGKPKKGARMGMFSDDAEAYLSRLESVWGEEE